MVEKNNRKSFYLAFSCDGLAIIPNKKAIVNTFFEKIFLFSHPAVRAFFYRIFHHHYISVISTDAILYMFYYYIFI